jgi:glycosyltransferase involved in cell wall biosynthesis
MKLSGFAMVRNASKYYFPIKESIESVLPIVDEFIVALGNCDADDNTEALIRSIQSPKIKIFHRVWDEKLFYDGEIFRQETNFALEQCTGDWCIYLQADELVHEDDHAEIIRQCNKYLDDQHVQGMLFNYLHFWGDYEHYIHAHSWYESEIRIVRNHAGITSYKDAQSFRINNEVKLNVIKTRARIFHYGWVRPPQIMQSKRKEQSSMHFGKKRATDDYAVKASYFEYGPLGRLNTFKGTHPRPIHELIPKHHWKDKLDYGKTLQISREKMSHERTKYRVLSFIENNLLRGRKLFGYRNWNLLNGPKYRND